MLLLSPRSDTLRQRSGFSPTLSTRSGRPRESRWRATPRATDRATEYAMSFTIEALQTDLFIGGAWSQGSARARIDVMDPSSESRIASVADASIEDALGAVSAAWAAAPGWASTPPRDRAEILRRAFELMIARTDDLAELI